MMHQHDRWVESRCVRTRRHKLIRNYSPSRIPELPVKPGAELVRERPKIEFYDLAEDPLESRDLGSDTSRKATRRRLAESLSRWMREVGDPLLRGPVVTPYYRSATTAVP